MLIIRTANHKLFVTIANGYDHDQNEEAVGSESVLRFVHAFLQAASVRKFRALHQGVKA